MKHISLFLLFLSSTLFALPIGNPAQSRFLSNGLFLCGCEDSCFPYGLEVGFYGDYVFERHLTTPDFGEFSKTSIWTNAGYVALNVCNRLDVFGVVGATQFQFETLFSEGGADFLRLFNTGTDLSWGVGGHMTLLRLKCLTFGLSGQYFKAEPDFNRLAFFTINGSEVIYLNNTKLEYEEWQVGGGVSTCIELGYGSFVSPYIAVKWSEVDYRAVGDDPVGILGPPVPNKADNLRKWGYGVGATLVANSMWSVTVEGRFYDELAFFVNSSLRF